MDETREAHGEDQTRIFWSKNIKWTYYFSTRPSSRCQETFLFSKMSRAVLGPTQPRIQQVSEVELPGREDSHSPLPSSEDKNEWSYISTPPYVLS